MSQNGSRNGNHPRYDLTPFRQRLAKQMPKLKNLLPDYYAPERYISLAMLAIYREPKLQQACIEAPDTVIDSILRGAQCGFEIGGPVPGAHLVPFRAKLPGTDRHAMQCVMIPDYRGLISLAIDSGSILDADPWLVYEGEQFKVRGGTDRKIEHEPDYALDRSDNKITHAYIVFTLPNGATKFHVMARADIDRVRASSKAKDGGPWVQWYGQMALKTVVKRGLKTVPMNPNNAAGKKLAMALEADNRFETGEVGAFIPEWGEDEDTISAVAAEKTRQNLDDLRERMQGRDVTEEAEAHAQAQDDDAPPPSDSEPWPDDAEPEPQPQARRPRSPRQPAAAAAAAQREREPGEDDEMP